MSEVELERHVFVHLVRQPVKGKVGENALHPVHKDGDHAHVNVRKPLYIRMQHLDCQQLASLAVARLVHLGERRNAKRLLVDPRKRLVK